MVRWHELNIIFSPSFWLQFAISKRGIFSRCASRYSFIIEFCAVLRCDEAFLSVGGDGGVGVVSPLSFVWSNWNGFFWEGVNEAKMCIPNEPKILMSFPCQNIIVFDFSFSIPKWHCIAMTIVFAYTFLFVLHSIWSAILKAWNETRFACARPRTHQRLQKIYPTMLHNDSDNDAMKRKTRSWKWIYILFYYIPNE